MDSPSYSPEHPAAGEATVEATVELQIAKTPDVGIGRYKLIEKIGAGGMGKICLGEDERLNRKVALKLLPAMFTQDADRVRRFELEAKAASALNHPNIITIYEIGEADGAHYIVTEYIQGQTLRQQMTERLTIETALDVAIQIANALKAAHSVGIVHRDIKPENVMVRPDGLVKVLDFGIAKLIERPSAPKSLSIEPDEETVALKDFSATKGDSYKATPAKALNETSAKHCAKTVTLAINLWDDLLGDLKDLKQELEFQAKLRRSSQADASEQKPPTQIVSRSDPSTSHSVQRTDRETECRQLTVLVCGCDLFESEAYLELDGEDEADEARDALAAVYATYTEGFATPDLVDAKALLETLS